MTTMRLLLSLLLLLKASTLADAFAYAGETACTNFTFAEEGDVVRELCFSLEGYGPSPASMVLENGTEVTEYIGGYSEHYMFTDDLEGLTTGVEWEDEIMAGETQPCVAHANGENCTSCMICEDGLSWSADCTNLDQGRNVDCETFPPFFPFLSTYEYMGTVPPTEGGSMSSTSSSTSVGDELSSGVPTSSPFPQDPSGTEGPTTATSATATATASITALLALASAWVMFLL